MFICITQSRLPSRLPLREETTGMTTAGTLWITTYTEYDRKCYTFTTDTLPLLFRMPQSTVE